MTLRTATEADLPAIALIQSASPEASQWDPASYLGYECLLAEEGGDVLGFLAIRQTAPDEHEILNLAVEPRMRRHGVARRLLQQTVTAGAWFLEVRESNLPAIRLYESVGFRRVGQRENYYLNPPELAIVMKIDS